MQCEAEQEPRQQGARYPEDRHRSRRHFDSAGLSLPLDNERIHLGNLETSLGKSTSPMTAVHTGVETFRTEAYPICTVNVEKAGQLRHA